MKYAQDRHRPAGDWTNFTNMVSVVGVQHRRDSAAAFASAARKAERSGLIYGVNLQFEPNNPHDPNALAVIGAADRKRLFGGIQAQEWKIGYLPREVAAEVCDQLIRPGLSVGIELYSIYEGREGFVDFKIIVLAPPGHSHSARSRRAKRAREQA